MSVLEDAVLYRSNLSPMAWFYAMPLFANNAIVMRSTFLRKQLGLGVKSRQDGRAYSAAHGCA